MEAGCVFCRIASGELSAHLVHEDELTVAFLDTHPIRPGHVQVIPREHHTTFDGLPPATAARVVHVGQRVAKVLKRVHGVPRVAFLFTGGDMAHAHAHLVPMHEKTDITSRRYIAEEHLTFRPLPEASAAELSGTAALLRSPLGQDAPPLEVRWPSTSRPAARRPEPGGSRSGCTATCDAGGGRTLA